MKQSFLSGGLQMRDGERHWVGLTATGCVREFWEVMHVMPAFCVWNVCVLAPAGHRFSSVCCHIPLFCPSTLARPSPEQFPVTSHQWHLSAPQSGQFRGKLITEGNTHVFVLPAKRHWDRNVQSYLRPSKSIPENKSNANISVTSMSNYEVRSDGCGAVL